MYNVRFETLAMGLTLLPQAIIRTKFWVQYVFINIYNMITTNLFGLSCRLEAAIYLIISVGVMVAGYTSMAAPALLWMGISSLELISSHY